MWVVFNFTIDFHDIIYCMSSKRLDFLSIGDIAVDAFIRIKDAGVTCDLKKEHCKICFPFGEKIPYESIEIVPAVGNAANAAVCAARLGLSSGLIGNIGTDDFGAESIKRLKRENVNTEWIRKHRSLPTNFHFILWYEDERTILTKHNPYPLSFPHIEIAPRWLYLSSLPEHSLPYHKHIVEFLDNHPETKLAFQPGTLQIKMGYHALASVYGATDVFLCNKQEAQKIIESEENDIKFLLKTLAKLGPKTVVVTDGQKGAYAYDGSCFYFQPIFPDKRTPVSRTGAGDAFSATLISMLIKGLPLEEALLRAPINSSSVVQEVGAQKGLLNLHALEEVLKNAPLEYKLKKL